MTFSKMLRCRAFAVSAAVAVAVAAVPSSALADDWPQKGKSVQMLVGFAAGGSVDVGARLLAAGLEKELGTNVVVVNKPGASGQLAYTMLTQAKPDGYTIGTVGFPSTVVTYMDPTRQATYTRKDFQLLGLHVVDPTVFAVKQDSPFKTLKELVEYTKANPRKVRITTTGIQSDETFSILQFEKQTGAKFALVHFSQGVAQGMTAFLGNKVEVLCANVGDLLSQYKRGEVRILGVMDAKRSHFYPDVQTFEEQGYKLYGASSRGFAAPGGTPKDAVERISAAMKKVVESDEHKRKMEELGLTLGYLGPAQYEKYWADYEVTLKDLLPLTKEFKE
jgi:tripartite-type tricarboxylate transporter receptor subunit TctC